MTDILQSEGTATLYPIHTTVGNVGKKQITRDILGIKILLYQHHSYEVCVSFITADYHIGVDRIRDTPNKVRI
jgi:hypothetical protein